MSPVQSEHQPRQDRDAADARSPSSTAATTGSGSTSAASNDEGINWDDYPPQLHSGAVGYGPEYGRGAGLDEKMTGVKEELKGRVLRKPDLVEKGRERRTGELKRKQQEEADVSAFEDPGEKEKSGKQDQEQQPPSYRDHPEGQRAANVNPGEQRGEPNARMVDARE
ncbi:hypothetical protein FA95DRAFT_1607272 [Auriscalpium vulgare]|uniref:Uncharacterized protein n=1 Tax=Auriscalpium vulgare TaxID=40419 RepID=A0ACB8RPX3_9AGAM|nr:hypothetical protein FA95DRAFT_1607272 [Auriscalpium vulgare]